MDERQRDDCLSSIVHIVHIYYFVSVAIKQHAIPTRYIQANTINACPYPPKKGTKTPTNNTPMAVTILPKFKHKPTEEARIDV